MNTPKRKILFAGCVSAASILLAIHYVHPENAILLPSRVELRAPKVTEQAHAVGLQWLGALPNSTSDRQRRPQTFGEEIAALTATRDPEGALTAYGIIEGCEALRSLFEPDAMPQALLRRKEQCATITDAMRRSRFDYLRTAAFAGAPGAGSFWFRYGPSGDKEALLSRQNDPSVIEWKQQAMALLIRDGDQGDINALQDLMNGYAGNSPGFDPDPQRALAYAIAYRDAVSMMDGPVFNKPTDAELNALAEKLSPEQVDWAKTKAKAVGVTKRRGPMAGSRQ